MQNELPNIAAYAYQDVCVSLSDHVAMRSEDHAYQTCHW